MVRWPHLEPRDRRAVLPRLPAAVHRGCKLETAGLSVLYDDTQERAGGKFASMALIGLRVPEDQEREGLDSTLHGEKAYHM